MRDVAGCMRDGYSTAGTSGTGLGATSRLSTEFDLFSEPGKGTVVMSRVARRCSSDSTGSRRRPPPGVAPLEIGAVCVPLAGETECGDGWRVAVNGQTVAMLVVDGLGHGPLAATAARSAAQAFEEQPIEEPVSVMQSLDRRLLGSRGAVGACARLRAPEGKLHYAGVGNISGVIIDPHRSRGLVSLNGTLGLQSHARTAVRLRLFRGQRGGDALGRPVGALASRPTTQASARSMLRSLPACCSATMRASATMPRCWWRVTGHERSTPSAPKPLSARR